MSILYSPKEQFVNYPVLALSFTKTNSSFYLLVAAVLLLGTNLILLFSPFNLLVQNNRQILKESLYNTA
jgi:bacteriorhodopsin